ncbi:YggS family pyridoxal phosphate-dependent enzyme [Psychrobacillus sp.]|uniref:YggS family pyridoxal phosphate-dependent enzyme n=1 Tax=Psychrobacillus sp. TaxID=1871623 RepID=UPI0028BED500|nr:YggS family pyridoxal phosphate-dependent enzyme [Psychrobacillus sp.]
MTNVQQNLIQIKENMQEACALANRNLSDVTIIAVTKEVSVERTQEVIAAGIHHLGENRPEGLKMKLDAIIDEEVKWHYIGTLQTRKVKAVINEIDYLHSLDRLSLADEIEKRATTRKDCFVQVNVSEEESKHGLTSEEAEKFIKQLANYSRINVIGLMTMAPNTEDISIIRTVFRNLKQLQEKIAALQLPNAPCTELSMGMSGDYQIAIAEGATFVRIGTALVGKEKEGIV